jgi:AsmA protein
MKRVMKWAGGILLICVVGFAGLIIVLPMVLDPNDYKDKISKLVYEQSGFQLEIPGDITLNISPRLEVLFSLGQIRILSAPDFSGLPLLSSEEARVELSLLPLLKEKRLAIQSLQLHGVYCHLIRDTSGKGNWEITAAPAESSSPSTDTKDADPAPQVQASGKTKKTPTLELGAFDLSRVTVRYEDQQTGKIFELKDLSVQTGNVQDGQSFHLQSKFVLISSGSNNSALSVENALDADILFSLSAKTLQLENLLLNSVIIGFGVQDAEITLAVNTFIDLTRKNIKLKELSLSSGELSVQLRADVSDFSNPSFKGTLQIPEFSPNKFFGKYKLPQPVWKDSSALQQFGFSCEFAGDMKKIDVSTIDIVLDGARGKGRFVLIDPSNPAYDFKMHFDRLDLDRYATVAQQSEAVAVHAEKAEEAEKGKTGGISGNTSAPKAASLQPLFPVDLLRKLQFQLDLAVDSMKMKGAEVSRVELKASAGDGLLELKPFRAELYEGSVSAGVNLDVQGKIPQLKITKDLDHVEVGPLLTDMTGKDDVTGAAVLSLELTTKGNTKEQLIRNSNGTMNLALENGVIKKLHIIQVVRQAKAMYEKKMLVESAQDEPTGFAHISATGTIKEGVFINNDLKASSDLMIVTGAGKVDFDAEYVDYLLKVSLTRGLDRNEESGKTDYSKFVIPYKIHGNFSDLKEEADVVGLFKAQAQSLLMNELQKQLDKGDEGSEQGGKKEDSGQDLLQQGLKSLFGN